MRKLVIKDGNPPREFSLGAGLSIGSAAGNSIQLDGGKVEPRHASVVKKGEHVWIEDLNTRLGVAVNGKKVSRWALKKDDVIEIGGTALVYIEDDKPEPAPAAPVKAAADSSKVAMPAKPGRSGTLLVPKNAESARTTAASKPTASAPPARTVTPVSAKAPPAGNGAISPSSASGRNVAQMRGKSGLSSATGAGEGGSLAAGSSSRRMTADQNVAAAGQAALAALKERSARASAPQAGGSGTLKIVVAVLLMLVVLLSATTLYVLSRGGGGGNAAMNKEETAALERLKQKGPKAPQDLVFVKDKLFQLRAWEEVEALLGEPDLKFTDKITLYSADRGTYELPGREFRAWYTRDPFNMAETPGSTTAPVLLYQGDSEGRVTYLGPKMYSRLKLPPAPPP